MFNTITDQNCWKSEWEAHNWLDNTDNLMFGMISISDAVLGLRRSDVVNTGTYMPPGIVVKSEWRFKTFELKIEIFVHFIFEHEFKRRTLIHDDVDQTICFWVTEAVERIHPEFKF